MAFPIQHTKQKLQYFPIPIRSSGKEGIKGDDGIEGMSRRKRSRLVASAMLTRLNTLIRGLGIPVCHPYKRDFLAWWEGRNAVC